MTPWRTRPDLLRMAALALVAVTIWFTATGKWSARDWETPAAYSVDALETLARFQVSAEQGASLLTAPGAARLGAPATADWTLYPLPDFAWYWLAGRAVNAIGLVPASNLMLLLAHVLAVVSFFVCARVLGHRPVFAAVAAVLFGFSFSVWHRGLSHHSFALAFAVPPALLLVWLVARGGRLLRRRTTWLLGFGAAALIGGGSPYFLYLFGLMLAIAWSWQLLRARRRTALWFGAAVGAVCLGVFALTNAPFLLADKTENATLARGAGEADVYGLRWLDLIVPPANHHSALAGAWGRARAAHAQGELFSPYLGIVGLAGLAALAFVALKHIRRIARPAYAPWAAWLLAFALVGGINSWLARAGLDYFRASNRYSIHLFALILFFIVSQATRRAARWPRSIAWAVAIAVLALGLWDHIPRKPGRDHAAELHAAAESDRRLGARLEAALPAGSAVFQMPVARFPEQGPLGGMADYEHLRSMLGSRTLRFSYGLLADDSLLTWQHNLARLPAAEMLARLERAGFGAVIVNRSAYPDNAKTLEAALIAAGARAEIGDDTRAVFRLRPSGPLQPPPANDALRFARWDEAAPRPNESAVLLGRGWHAAERNADDLWRWAGQRATLLLFNADAAPREFRLRARVTTTAATTFSLQTGDHVHRENMPAYTARDIDLRVTLPPGASELTLASEAPARRAGPTDSRRIAFNLAAVRAEFSVPTAQ